MSFNVLIVDDSMSMRSVIRRVVEMSGYKVDNCYEASNGLAALSILEDKWVDLVISDINMPEMDGMELVSRMRKDDVLRMIPVVIVTTEGNEERVREAFELGARGYLKKPFLPEECRRMFLQVIGVQEDGEYAEDDEDSGDLDF